MRRIINICLCIVLAFSVCGCTKQTPQQENNTVNMENMINIYIVDGLKVSLSDTTYQLKNPDSLTASIEEVMSALIQAFEGDLTFYTYMLDDENNLNLEITLGVPVDEEERLAIQAAILETIFQLEDIKNIQLKLMGSDGEEITENTFSRESFYFYSNDESSINSIPMILCVPDATVSGLHKVVLNVEKKANVSDQELAIDALERLEYLPEGTKVNLVSVRDGICFLDMSTEFEGSVAGLSPELMIGGLINTVLLQTDAESVQIIIDGVMVPSYKGFVDLSEPIPYNADIVH